MSVKAWRLVKTKHSSTALDGEGARLFGGRWNEPGTAVVYLSESLALAALELFVHLGEHGRHLKFSAIKVTIPNALDIDQMTAAQLPSNWRTEPVPKETQKVGTNWAREKTTVAIRIPSVVVPQETNIVLNPGHPDFAKIVVDTKQPFSFDPRMWK